MVLCRLLLLTASESDSELRCGAREERLRDNTDTIFSGPRPSVESGEMFRGTYRSRVPI